MTRETMNGHSLCGRYFQSSKLRVKNDTQVISCVYSLTRLKSLDNGCIQGTVLFVLHFFFLCCLIHCNWTSALPPCREFWFEKAK